MAFVHRELKGELDVFNPALKQSGLAFEHASEELRSDPKIVQRAMKKDWRAVKYAVGPFDADLKFWTEVSETFPELPERLKKAYGAKQKAEKKKGEAEPKKA